MASFDAGAARRPVTMAAMTGDYQIKRSDRNEHTRPQSSEAAGRARSAFELNKVATIA